MPLTSRQLERDTLNRQTVSINLRVAELEKNKDFARQQQSHTQLGSRFFKTARGSVNVKQLGAAKNFPDDPRVTFYRPKNLTSSRSAVRESNLSSSEFKSTQCFLPVGLGALASDKVPTLNGENAYKMFAGERVSSRKNTTQDS